MKRSAFTIIDIFLGAVVIFALFMYFLPTVKSVLQKPVDNQPTIEQHVNDKIQDVSRLRQEAEEQNRKMLQQINY